MSRFIQHNVSCQGNPTHKVVYDWFKRNGPDIDWIKQGIFTTAVTIGIAGKGALETAFKEQSALRDLIGVVDNTWMGWIVDKTPFGTFKYGGQVLVNLAGFSSALTFGWGKTLYDASYCSWYGGDECWDNVSSDFYNTFSVASGIYAKDLLTDILLLIARSSGYGLIARYNPYDYVYNIPGIIEPHGGTSIYY